MRPLVLALALVLAPPSSPAEPRVLSHLAELLALDDEQAAQGLPCDITATVTLYKPAVYYFFVQEGDVGAYAVATPDSPWKLMPGDVVRIEGKSERGAYAPVLYADRVTRLRFGGLPAPVTPPSWAAVRNTDKFDSRFAEIQGRLVSVRPEYLDGRKGQSGAYLELERNGERIGAFLDTTPDYDLSGLVQSDIAARGTITPFVMVHKQRHDAGLAIDSPANLRVITRRTLDWEKYPKIPLPQLLTHNGSGPPRTYFRTEGTVTYIDDVNTVIIQDGFHMIKAQKAVPLRLRLGTRYEIFGRLERGERQVFHIAEAQFQEIGPGAAIPPRMAQTSEIGLGELDDEIIRVRSQVVDVVWSRELCVLKLMDNGMPWEALLPQRDSRCPTWIAAGSLVEVTGKVQHRWVEGRRFPVQTALLMRSPGDVRVLSQPSWWRRLPLGKLLLAVAVLSLLALVWIELLRRRVKAQTSKIEKQNLELEESRKKAEEGSRLKSEFLANMSHEIRTPMNGVLGMTEILLDSAVTPEQRADLLTVKSSGESLLTILNDILDLSKIEAGKMILNPVPFNVRDCMEETMRIVGFTAGGKKLDLVCDIAPEVPQWVAGDSTRLRQVLLKLGGNAVKFTDRGQVAVCAAVESSDEQSVVLHFTVSDTGIGIRPEKQSVIFDAFTQGDASISRRHGGTGLGLAISSRLVQLMKGRIWVESEFGRGSRFHFTARFELAAAAGPGGAPSVREQLSGRGSSNPAHGVLRILVAEDNVVNQQLIRRMLEKWQHSVHLVDNGEEAVRLAAQEPFDLILMDVQMPGIDGLEATARIREAEKGAGAQRFIYAMTAHAMLGDREQCLAAGMDGYLSKPIRSGELADVLATVEAACSAVVEPPAVSGSGRIS